MTLFQGTWCWPLYLKISELNVYFVMCFGFRKYDKNWSCFRVSWETPKFRNVSHIFVFNNSCFTEKKRWCGFEGKILRIQYLVDFPSPSTFRLLNWVAYLTTSWISGSFWVNLNTAATLGTPTPIPTWMQSTSASWGLIAFTFGLQQTGDILFHEVWT